METRYEIDELKRLRAENEALKKAYAELALHHKCSEKVIEVADELFDMDLKKSTNKSYHTKLRYYTYSTQNSKNAKPYFYNH